MWRSQVNDKQRSDKWECGSKVKQTTLIIVIIIIIMLFVNTGIKKQKNSPINIFFRGSLGVCCCASLRPAEGALAVLWMGSNNYTAPVMWKNVSPRLVDHLY